MTVHQLSLLAAVGAATPFQRAKLRLLLCISPATRKRHLEYRRVSGILASALGTDDDLVSVQVKLPRPFRRPKASVVLLCALVGIILLEWGTYTLPTMIDIAKELAHSCGLR